jgi:menaquinol-cytochrome c reductase iron-sulfur subunit
VSPARFNSTFVFVSNSCLKFSVLPFTLFGQQGKYILICKEEDHMGESESQDGQSKRRDFLKVVIVAIGGVITAGFGVPAIAYVLGPALQQGTSEWLQLGSVNKVEVGVPTLFKTTIQTQTGWIKAEEEFSAYVLTEDGQNFVVLSNVCTHLGCRVRWIADKNGFYCPCHNGAFSKDGKVIGGPPPKPLDRFESKVEKDVLFVKRG